MKAVILAGGLGTRISEESVLRPKPMIEIGSRPLLWHIMKIYSSHGVNDFVVCCGYKANVIKEFFANYMLYTSDVTFDLQKNATQILRTKSEHWKVTLIDTGEQTMTGGRLRRVREFLSDEDFCFTYGDGLSDINLTELIRVHKEHGKLATLTAVQPHGRYGTLDLDEDRVARFQEKPADDGSWINGGFFVLNPKVIDLISDDTTIWERGPVESLSRDGELMAYRHLGFWHAMDTLRDKIQLEDLWAKNKAPWKVWE